MTVWTGPAIGNPRNRRGRAVKASIDGQSPRLRDHLLGTGSQPHLPHDVRIVTTSGDVLTGRTCHDVVWEPVRNRLTFYFWEPRAAESDNRVVRFLTRVVDNVGPYLPTTAWRKAYRAEADMNAGVIFITPIDVAPDRIVWLSALPA